MRKTTVILLLLILAIIVLAVTPLVGMKTISLGSVFGQGTDTTDADIFWKIRLPRVCVSFLVGAALAIGGMAFQAIFRNPLAEPFTLGVSSGASFGAALYVRFGIPFAVFGVSGISVSAFLGAILSILIVYGLTGLWKRFSAATPLLAGVAMSFFFSGAILLIQYMSGVTDTFRILRWLMGAVEVVGFETVLDLFPFVVLGTVIILYHTRELNLMTTGEDLATSRGVNVKRTAWALFFAVSLMVGGVVAACGPIGFVGIMMPHICRLMIGADHRWLMPATFLFGGAFLTLCDTLSRMLIAPAEIPIGVITALLGGPFFLWLLLRRSSEGGVLRCYER